MAGSPQISIRRATPDDAPAIAEVGRQIAKDNPKASVDELAALVKKAVDDGKLIVIDRGGKLAWSNAVAVWDHGLAPAGSRPGKIAVPAGDASVY